MKQFTHLNSLNSLIRLMDNRLDNLLNTNDIKYYTEYCLLEHELKQLLTGHQKDGYRNKVGKFAVELGWVKPVYVGHLHVDKDLEYLLPTIRIS